MDRERFHEIARGYSGRSGCGRWASGRGTTASRGSPGASCVVCPGGVRSRHSPEQRRSVDEKRDGVSGDSAARWGARRPAGSRK
jgi:hypothetical protein